MKRFSQPRWFKFFPAFLICISVLLVLAVSVDSKSRKTSTLDAKPADQSVISVTSTLVALPVSVTDKHGNFVSGLKQDNFHVYEDGRLQKISLFQQEDSPASIGLVIDHSGSMESKLPSVISAILGFAHSSNPQDEMFVVDFNDDVWVELIGGKPFTSDPIEIAHAISAVSATGRTALYDAVAEGLLHLQLAHREKKALVIISDGGDNASKHTYSQILSLARQSQVMIYSLGLVGDLDEEENPHVLKQLAHDTGGVAFFPDTAGKIRDAATYIARDLREQYIVGYVPDSQETAKQFRKVQVRVSAAAAGALRVRTRPGYSTGPDNNSSDQKNRSPHDGS